MAESKASRLKQLSELVSVPPFTIITRDEEFDPTGLARCQYMVRSSSALEDQADFSNAGQFTTLGPLPLEQVDDAVAQLWQNNAVDEIIIQQYVDAEYWGVAFCFSEASMLVEYSTVFEGVTSGQVNPFTALLPSDITRYRQLQQELLKIYRRFGPCDVEFVNLEQPQFVQVRPITRDIEFDDSFVVLKMALQELSMEHWHENDICRMLAERDDYSQMLAGLYLDAITRVYRDHLKRELVIPDPAFIRISDQFFMAVSLEEQLTYGTWRSIRLALKLPALLASIREQKLEDCTLPDLMYDSILLSLAYELNNKPEIFESRERVRNELERRMTPGRIEPDFQYENILSSTIHFDRQTACWNEIGPRDSQGIIVVPGDLDSGPFFVLENRDQKIPPDVVVVCRHLYPEIGHSITAIKGIICQHGALSAHVAILAREYQVPLKIQASIDDYE